MAQRLVLEIPQMIRTIELIRHGEHSNQILTVRIFPLTDHLIKVINMNLQKIKNRVLSLPTIMGISEEILIIKELMIIKTDDLIQNKDIFRFILDSLELSHTDSGFMELTKENENIFIDFYHWLNRINDQLNMNININIIDCFSLSVEDVNKLMSPYK